MIIMNTISRFFKPFYSNSNRFTTPVIMRITTFIIILCCITTNLWAQPTIRASRHTLPANSTVVVDFKLDDFTDILQTEYSVNWDPNVIEFVDIADVRMPIGMNRNSFDLSGVAQGFFTVFWETPTDLAQTIPDDVTTFKIRFRTLAAAGGLNTPIEFTDNPTPVIVYRENAPNVNIGFFTETGRVSVIAPPCRQSDSTSLRQIYDSTNGANWTTPWDVSRPINYWEGVLLNQQGCVEVIDLDGNADGMNNSQNGNGLVGILNDFNIPTLKKMYLSGNQLIGTVPNFTGLPQLEDLSLDNNNFSFTTELANLFALQQLNIAGNNFSFDDVLANIDNVPNYIYAPQQDILEPETINLIQGDNYTIDLGIDPGLNNNEYEWRKDGVVHSNLTGINRLSFTNIQTTDAGVYTCIITNPDAPDLTLQSAPITLVVSCPPITTDLNEEICAGSSYTVGNVTFQENGYYEVPLQTVMGCDSLVRLTLTINDALTTNLTETTCDGGSYTLGDQTYTESGNYQHTFTTVTGCDSTVFLQLTVATNEVDNQQATICAGEVYNVGDNAISITGSYQFILNTVAGCDSTINLELEVLEKMETFLDEQICAGSTYTVGNNTYSETGSYQADLQSTMGCDSTVFLELEVVAAIENNLVGNICAGEEYRIGNEIFTETGSYQVPLTSVSGCDSLVNLDLQVNEVITTNLEIVRCVDESYMVGNSVYTETGIYQDNLQSVAGCDSIVNLNLTIQDITPTTVVTQICAGEVYEIGEELFNSSGDYEITLMSIAGCDSLIQLNLTVVETLESNLIQQICTGESLVVGTESFTETGNYEVVLQGQAGCDSIVMLNLTVVDFVEEFITMDICAGETFTLGGEDFDETGQYQVMFTTQNGCDSLVNLDLKVADEATLGKANVGADVGTCKNWTAIGATPLAETIGEWQSLGGLELIPTLEDLLLVENLQDGDNLFEYSLSTIDCPVFSTDTLIVNFTNPNFSLTDDIFKIKFGTSNSIIDLLANDTIADLDDVQVRFLEEVNTLKLNQTTTGVFEVIPEREYKGIRTLEYEVCNIPCPEVCRYAMVTIEVVDPGQDQPTLIITPNGDGLNEVLIFDDLEDYSGHELVITNRWGGQVFAASPYQNNWDGRNANGKPLPEGTYYYLLRLDIADGQYQVGSVTIKR